MPEIYPPSAGAVNPPPKPSEHKVNGYVLSLREEDQLGRGSFGRVVIGWKENKGRDPKTDLAAKLITFGAGGRTASERELHLLRKLPHLNVVRLLDSFEFAYGFEKYYALVMPIAKGTLADNLPLPNAYARKLCVLQLVNAVSFLHQNDVMHRDIKPGNILYFRVCGSEGAGVCSNVWKLADFGIGKEVRASAASANHTICGTPAYEAPEVLNGGPYSLRADVFSLAVVVCEVLASIKRRCGPESGEFNRIWGAEGLGSVDDTGFASSLEFLMEEREIRSFLDDVLAGDSINGEFFNRFLWKEVPSLVVSLVENVWQSDSNQCNLALALAMWKHPRVVQLISARPELSSALLCRSKIFSPVYYVYGAASAGDVSPKLVPYPWSVHDDNNSMEESPYPFLLEHRQVLLAQTWLLESSSLYRHSGSGTWGVNFWRPHIEGFRKAFGIFATANLRDQLFAGKEGAWFQQHREEVGLPDGDE